MQNNGHTLTNQYDGRYLLSFRKNYQRCHEATSRENLIAKHFYIFLWTYRT